MLAVTQAHCRTYTLAHTCCRAVYSIYLHAYMMWCVWFRQKTTTGARRTSAAEESIAVVTMAAASMAESLTLGEMKLEWREDGVHGGWHTCTEYRQDDIVRVLLRTKEEDPDATSFATGMGGSSCKYYMVRVNRPSREFPGGSITFQPAVRNSPYGRRPNIKCRLVRCGEVLYEVQAEIKNGRLSVDCFGAMDGEFKINHTFPLHSSITAGRINTAITRVQILRKRITKHIRVKLLNNSIVLKPSFMVWSPNWNTAVRIRLHKKTSLKQATLQRYMRRA